MTDLSCNSGIAHITFFSLPENDSRNFSLISYKLRVVLSGENLRNRETEKKLTRWQGLDFDYLWQIGQL